MWNFPKPKNWSFIAIKPIQNWESPAFFCTWLNVLFLRYLFRNKSCHNPSSLTNLNNHLLNKHLFWISRFCIPRPPRSFGWQRIFHFTNLYFFLCWSFCQKKSWSKVLVGVLHCQSTWVYDSRWFVIAGMIVEGSRWFIQDGEHNDLIGSGRLDRLIALHPVWGDGLY